VTTYLPDVNVLVASMRPDHPDHATARAFLVRSRLAGHAFVTPVEVLAAALRVLTLDVWVESETSASARELIHDWVAAASAETVSHPPGSWRVLGEFARTLSLGTREIPDALLAASAIVSRTTIVTFDRGFARYPGLNAEILSNAA
jgi:toxin-antitoxin system PIN domain toxin